MPPCYRSKFRGGFSIRKITSSASLYIEQRSTTLQHDCSAISLAQFGVTGKDIGYCVGNDLISIDTGDFVLFQSTFPRGERPSSSTRIPFLSQFQSTFPRGERRLECRVWKSIIYFNPRSRVGNDVDMHGTYFRWMISIHVPAWGTTVRLYSVSNVSRISIHVPAWGTTLNPVSIPLFIA